MKRLLYSVFIFLVMTQTVGADETDVTKQLLRNKVEAAISVLQKEDIDQQEKNKQIIEIVTPLFDFQLMAKLSLGRKYWPGLTQEERQRFTELFTRRLQESYLDKLRLYTDEKVVFKTSVKEKRKIKIPTELISKNNTISMLYKFHELTNSWLIYDIEVQGVSIISTYRSQFDHILSNGTIDDLLIKLEQPEQPKNK
ncbi:MAG: ABC transporter substrate-binding protein [Deltaproteobacteria bacterium]|nr:ABC transporter substrate-binding protein [Deltaproteobacteria bacterium]MBW2012438.1 ABC transporter substrate-binding protein [Deltaproteobacteria bacterium]